MNVLINIADINKRFINYSGRIINTVMDNCFFIRIIYSNELFSMNGIYIDLSFNIQAISNYNYKYTYTIDYIQNTEVINDLIRIEHMILEGIGLPLINKNYKLKDLLRSQSISIHETSGLKQKGKYNFTLKISGVWLTDTSCGLTYKFFTQP